MLNSPSPNHPYQNTWFKVIKEGDYFLIQESDYIVFLIHNSGKFLFISEFRKAYNKSILNIPCGSIQQGESHSICIEREIQEEILVFSDDSSPINLQEPDYLGSTIVSPNRYFATLHVYSIESNSQFTLSREHAWLDFCDYQELARGNPFPMPSILAILFFHLIRQTKND